MKAIRSLWIATAAVMGLALAAPPAQAQYPDRPVTLIVPYAPGGAVDVVGRMLGRMLEKRLGTPFVIVNKPGASSGLAATFVANAPADGYTILLATSTTMAINSAVFKNPGYAPLTDLVPISLAASVPFVLIATEKLPVSSVADLVKLAKSKPGELIYGSSGPGSAAHLFMQDLASTTGIKLTHVPYRGSSQALQDLVAGRTQIMFADVPVALPLLQAKTVRALGVSTAKRLANAPDLPTVAESGVAGYDASSWHMIVAPANTPKDIVQKLHDALKETQADPEFVAAVSARGVNPEVSPPLSELRKYVEDETRRWGKIVEEAGLAKSM